MVASGVKKMPQNLATNLAPMIYIKVIDCREVEVGGLADELIKKSAAAMNHFAVGLD
jgi:hypothetical protein